MTIYTKIDDTTIQRDDGLIIKKSPFKEWSLYTEFLGQGGIPNEPVKPDLWIEIRLQRDNLLRNSDIDVLSDKWALMTIEQQTAWTNYRQALRNIPQTYTDANKIVWPVKPN
jgi:hypothetical protein